MSHGVGRLRGVRRGSALILVLLMTLAVAGLSIAAIFLSSSAGLLSRFYDQEREFQLAAQSALELVRMRLELDSSIAVPDTGVVQLLSGYQVRNASDALLARVSVNVHAAVTGDSSGLSLPFVTLLASSYDANGTRHVRRMDLRRESFSRYSLFADEFNASRTFGPGTVGGKVHTNDTWRSGAGASAATYLDSVSAVVALAGTATYVGDTTTGVPHVRFPRDSTFPLLAARASDGDLSFAPVQASGAGWLSGSRLEFVTVDVDADAVIDEDEGFVRVFDLSAGMDTSRLSVGLGASDLYEFFVAAKRWNDPVLQNQCGAFYYRSGRWQFFPVATHRADWAQDIIQATGSANVPSVTNPVMNQMDDYDFNALAVILQQRTATCFPAGSPFLLTTERFTNASGGVTGGASDTYPWGTAPSYSWPAGSRHGGFDTTFTGSPRTCTIDASGTCSTASVSLGTWKSFGGSPISGVSTTIRQTAELAYLWPLFPSAQRNPDSRRVVSASAGPLFVSGTVRGNVTLHVAGDVRIIGSLKYAQHPADDGAIECSNQLGLLAVGDILVSNNALTRGRRFADGDFPAATFTALLSPERDVTIHGSLMSLTGTVGVEGATTAGLSTQACPHDASVNSSGGCLAVVGSMIMRTYSDIHGSGNSGFRYAGVKDPCQETRRRPPYFPLTNRFTPVRTLEIEPSLANTPDKIRAILMRLKGRTL